MKISPFRYTMILLLLLGLLVAACGEDDDDDNGGGADDTTDTTETTDTGELPELVQDVRPFDDAFLMRIPETWAVDTENAEFGRLRMADAATTLEAESPQNGILVDVYMLPAPVALDLEEQLQTELGSYGLSEPPTIETRTLENGYEAAIASGDFGIGAEGTDIPGYSAVVQVDNVLVFYLVLSLEGDQDALSTAILESLTVDAPALSAALFAEADPEADTADDDDADDDSDDTNEAEDNAETDETEEPTEADTE